MLFSFFLFSSLLVFTHEIVGRRPAHDFIGSNLVREREPLVVPGAVRQVLQRVWSVNCRTVVSGSATAAASRAAAVAAAAPRRRPREAAPPRASSAWRTVDRARRRQPEPARAPPPPPHARASAPPHLTVLLRDPLPGAVSERHPPPPPAPPGPSEPHSVRPRLEIHADKFHRHTRLSLPRPSVVNRRRLFSAPRRTPAAGPGPARRQDVPPRP